ncbi:unnamed protein product [Trichogramma brassicae]|uniref:Uncharacterized protein n=1 Tax=Trichogramma brassicae TaxID=86971 RepID=A0A6H5HWD0_9HYME|nr:unnamed protein product [Trichogramma brassicae]
MYREASRTYSYLYVYCKRFCARAPGQLPAGSLLEQQQQQQRRCVFTPTIFVWNYTKARIISSASGFRASSSQQQQQLKKKKRLAIRRINGRVVLAYVARYALLYVHEREAPFFCLIPARSSVCTAALDLRPHRVYIREFVKFCSGDALAQFGARISSLSTSEPQQLPQRSASKSRFQSARDSLRITLTKKAYEKTRENVARKENFQLYC